MKKNHMTKPGDGVLVGLSGGADSVALLLLLWKLREKLQISLSALHVHHGLRGTEADRDAAFSKSLCEQLGITFYEYRIDAAKEAREGGCSVEEAGRKARYRLYEETALTWERKIHRDTEDAEVCHCCEENMYLSQDDIRDAGLENDGYRVHIATAHHADDNAETILLNLFRGSGLSGLSGIDPVRGRIIRPLLWAERSEIQAWLCAQEQKWVEDSTNHENEYSRNWIRNKLLSAVKERLNAQAVRHIDQAGKYIRQADEYFSEKAEKWIAVYAPHGKADAKELLKQADIIQGYVIRKLFEKNKMPLKDVTEAHIESVRDLLSQDTGKSVSLPHGFMAVNTYGVIEVLPRGKATKGRNAEQQTDCLKIPILSKKTDGFKKIEFGNEHNDKFLKMRVFPCENTAEFPKNQYTKWLDYDRIKADLSLRHRQPGDYFTLPSGGRKMLKSWMIDEKIPRQERDEIWLLAEEKHILWIVGYRLGAYYKITDGTKTILEVEFNGGKSSG